MAKKPALARGLDSIFSDNTPSDGGSGGVLKLRISDVEPKSDQPRKDIDPEALSQLADSIAANGVLQPILVREVGSGGMYQIIAGERRWRASKLAGLLEIPAIVMDADDLTTAQIALIENIQRTDLNPYEEACAYRDLAKGFGLTQEEVSARLGKSRSAVANSLRLLGLKDRSNMEELAKKIVAKNLSVRETEAAVRALNKARPKKEEDDEEVRVDYTNELERRVTDLCGRYCRITSKGRRKTVTVEYGGEDDLEELLSAICGKNITEELN